MINALKERGHEILICSAKKVDSNNIRKVFGREISYDKEICFWPYVFDPYDPKSIYENTLKSLMCKKGCDLLIDTFSNSILPWADAVYFQGIAFVSVLPGGLKGTFFLPFRTLLRHTNKRSNYGSKIAMACSQFSAKKIEATVGHEVKVLYPQVSDFFRIDEVQAGSRKDIVLTVSQVLKRKTLRVGSRNCRII